MDLGAGQMLVAMATGIASAFAAATVLGWKVRGWIADINDKRMIAMSAFELRFNALVTAHETEDQRRHEENLKSFGRVNERLARMGNGSSRP